MVKECAGQVEMDWKNVWVDWKTLKMAVKIETSTVIPLDSGVKLDALFWVLFHVVRLKIILVTSEICNFDCYKHDY